jgi:ATP-binding cassette subfamily A (ABC1) protein 3
LFNFSLKGSVQHIKNKFGKGYELEIKVEKPPADQIKILLE